MKTLVIYYSLEGNTHAIGQEIATALNADTIRLKPQNEPSKRFTKYLWASATSMVKSTPKLEPITIDPQVYDLIVVGSPVWAWTYAPALKSYFNTYKISDKKVALFCCHGGAKGKYFERIKKALVGNQFVGEIDFRDPLKYDLDKAKITASEWAKELTTTP